MKRFFQDITAYHHYFNQKLGEQIKNHEQHLNERMAFLFSHIVLAHQVWNARILSQDPMMLDQTLPIDFCLDLDKSNFEATRKIVEEFDLATIINYQNSKGEKFSNTLSEILFHISNHSSHHKGQIVAELRQSGIAPVVTDYIFYKRSQEAQC